MLAYVMLYAVSVGAPVAVGTWTVAAILRRYGRAERGVWLAGLVLAIGVPLATLARTGPGSLAEPEAVGTGVLGLPELIAVAEEAAPFTLDAYLVVMWATLSGVLLARWAIGAYRLERASRAWPAGSIDGVEVRVTEDVGPAVAGVFRPRVLAPAWVAELPASERTLVLRHEQEHIRAADPAVVALARLVRVVLPWNPVTWLLASRLVRAVELDCDRRVLREGSDVRTYGSTLLDLSARRSGRLVAAAFAESEAPLRSRILAMTSPSRTVPIAAICASVVLGVVLLVGALEIPVPAVRIRFEVGSSGASLAADAGAPEAFQPSSTRPRLINEDEVQAVGQRELDRVMRQDPDALRPRFTPVSIQPVMLNRPEVARALLEAYPRDLRERVGGTTILRLRIGTDGAPLERTVEKSSGYAALDEAALRVVDLMRFEPARNRDQRVPVWVSQRATFVPVLPEPELDHHAHDVGPR